MKIFKRKVKIPKDAIWLVPGLKIKRWFALIIIGSVLAALGLTFLFKLEPIYFIVETAKKILHILPPEPVGFVFILLGAIIFIQAWKKTNFTTLGLNEERRQKSFGEVIYRKMKLDHGPKIVAVGGGTGLSTMLRGLKNYTRNLTAIVTVADDGGGSGMLRRDMGMLPPGDIRHCMEALANVEPVMERLLTYRFTEGTLAGQSFGNLILAALNGVTGSFEEAVAQMGQVLAVTGQILPVTSADVQLEALFENGSRVVGESQISDFKKQQDCRIQRVSLLPAAPKPLPAALEAIEQADLILLGPGSLYTSIIPNLLVDGIPQAIAQSRALKLYICNIMTQDGETEGYTAADHVQALMTHGVEGMLDVCLANSAPVPEELLERYRQEGAAPLVVDGTRITAMGLSLAEMPLISEEGGYARHDPIRLAEAVMEVYRRRAVRIFRGKKRYIIEE